MPFQFDVDLLPAPDRIDEPHIASARAEYLTALAGVRQAQEAVAALEALATKSGDASEVARARLAGLPDPKAKPAHEIQNKIHDARFEVSIRQQVAAGKRQALVEVYNAHSPAWLAKVEDESCTLVADLSELLEAAHNKAARLAEMRDWAKSNGLRPRNSQFGHRIHFEIGNVRDIVDHPEKLRA